jgi:hypothetical protein
MITDIKGDLYNGALRSKSSPLLLKYITKGLKEVDIVQGYIDHIKYMEKISEMEKFVREID